MAASSSPHAPDPELFVGQIFTTFQNFETSVRNYGSKYNTLFVKDNCRKSQFIEGLYEYATLVCKQGGRTKKSVSKGIRANLGTIKCGCPVMVRAVSMKCPSSGQYVYRLTKVVLDHNHQVSESTFKAYPENRRPLMTESVESLLNCKSVSNLDVRFHVEQTQGKTLLSSDIRNLKLRQSYTQQDDVKRVEEFIRSLKENGGDVGYGLDPNTNGFQYLVYMSQSMKSLVSQYPEVLIMDATYKTNHYLLPLLTVMCIDNNGAGHPVLHAFVRHEDTNLLGKCLEFLSEKYDYTKTSTVFVDKDLSEVAAVKRVMPHVELALCRFHMKQAVKRALQGKGLPAHVITALHGLFDQQACALTEENFEHFQQELCNHAPPPVVEYFRSNWWNCPQMWANHKNLDVPQLHVTTTNHLESYHGKIKSFLHSKMSLSEVLLLLQKYDTHLMQAANTSTTVEAMKTRYNSKDSDPVICEIYSNVTTFAAKLIVQQYTIAKKFVYSITSTCSTAYEIKSSADTTHLTTLISCNCKFFINLKLQCRHIFALRIFLRAPIYENVPSEHRFSRKLPSQTASNHEGSIEVCSVHSNSKTLTLEEKYLSAEKLMKEFSTYLSLLGTTAFQTRMEQLNSLLVHWKGNREAVIIGMEPSQFINDPTATRSTTDQTSDYALFTHHDTTDEPTASTCTSVQTSDYALFTHHDTTVEPTASTCISVQTSDYALFTHHDTTVEPTASTCISVQSSDSTPVTQQTTTVEPTASSSKSNNVLECQHTTANLSAFPRDDPSIPLTNSADSAASFVHAKLVRVKTKGRPRTKQMFTCRKRKVPMPKQFSELDTVHKVRMLLSGAVVHYNDLQNVYDVDDIRPCNALSSCLLDECVDIEILRSFFSDNAFNLLLSRIKEKQESRHCVCPACQQIDDLTLKMVRCDHCLQWFHFECAGLRSSYKSKVWFCQECWFPK